MRFVKPRVFHVAGTVIKTREVNRYLDAVGVENYTPYRAPSDAEALAELGGRVCYRSFEPRLNKNVTHVRKGNQAYLKNILESHHGSVVEHASDTYVFYDVSRVFTHEVVRHRAGCSFSQESLRYVRLDDLRCLYPRVLEEIGDAEKREKVKARWQQEFERAEEFQRWLAGELDLDNQLFDVKKKITSALRRAAPMGLATTIMMTANHRAWRHVIELRTSRHAEEEIRDVFYTVFTEQLQCYPNIYQDAKVITTEDGLAQVTFENGKI